MKRITILPSVCMLFALNSCALNFDEWLKAEGGKIRGFQYLVILGQSGQPFEFKPNYPDWEISLFRRPYRDRYSPVLPDTIDVLSRYQTWKHAVNQPDTARNRNFSGFVSRGGNHFLWESWTVPGYDSIPLTVFMIDSGYNSEVNVYRDTATGASVMNTDSNFAYLVSRNRQISCFNFSDLSVSNCISDTNDIRLGKVIQDGGFKYSISGSRIFKKGMSNQNVWISDSLFNMFGMMIHNGMVYACGTDGYTSCYGIEGCSGDYDPIIAKWNADGALIWKKNYEKANVDDIDKLFAIAVDEAGDIVTIGVTGPWDGGVKYIYSIVVDSNGVLADEKIFSNNSTSISSMNYLEDIKLVSLKNRTASLTFRGQTGGMSSFYAEISY